jgi:hypothetical protein
MHQLSSDDFQSILMMAAVVERPPTVSSLPLQERVD